MPNRIISKSVDNWHRHIWLYAPNQTRSVQKVIISYKKYMIYSLNSFYDVKKLLLLWKIVSTAVLALGKGIKLYFWCKLHQEATEMCYIIGF